METTEITTRTIETAINPRTPGLSEVIMTLVTNYGTKEEVERAREWLYKPDTIPPKNFTIVEVLFENAADVKTCKMIVKHIIGETKIPFFPIIKNLILMEIDDNEKEMFAGKFLREFLEDATCKDNLAEFYNKWKQAKQETIQILRDSADKISKVKKDVHISTIVGSSASLLGGVAATAGILATFVATGCTAIAVAAAAAMGGAVFGVAGGLTATGAILVGGKLSENAHAISDKLLKKQHETTKMLEEELDKYMEKNKLHIETAKMLGKVVVRFKEINENRVKVTIGIGDSFEQELGFVRSVRKELKEIEGKLDGTCIQKIVTLGGKEITRIFGTTITRGALTLTDDVIGVTARTAATAARVVGVAVGALVITIDIITIVKTSMEVHKGSPDKIAEDIRKAADELEAKEVPELKELIMKAQLEATSECEIEEINT